MASFPCKDDPSEVLASIYSVIAKQKALEEELDKLNKFINGGLLEEVQLGEGEPTPTLRNLSHLVKSAAATLDDSDVSGKFSDAANGGETLRMLSDRFGDVVNVKDFGAVGDGIADDTEAADAWLAAEGGMKYVPAGDYLVRGTVYHYPEGRWWDGVHTDLDGLYIAPALTLFGGADVGTDYPGLIDGDSNAWDGATQGPFVDPFDKVLYVTRQNSSNEVRISALRWSENPEERVALGHSPFGFNLGHQSNALYRPSAFSEPLFFFPRNYHIAEGQTAYPYTVRVTKWDYRSPDDFTVMREFTLFDDEDYQTDSLLRFGISFDSKYMFCEAVRRSDDVRIVRFWDVTKMLKQSSDDISALFEFESARPEGTAAGGQAVVSDGKVLYQLSGDQVTYISCTTLNGDFCFHRPKKKFISKRYSVNSNAEAEGIFWAPWNGHIELFYMTCDRVYDKGDDVNYTRRDTFWCLSMPNMVETDGVHAAYKEPSPNSSNVPDLDKAVEPGWYYTQSDYANMPTVNPGYLLVIRHIFDSWNGIQMHIGRGSVKNMWLRSFDAGGVFGSWEKVTFATDSNATRFGSLGLANSGVVKGTRPSSAQTTLITFYDSQGSDVKDRLGHIRFITGSSSENDEKLQFGIYNFVSNSEDVQSTELVLDSNGMYFRPSGSNSVDANLGSPNRRWDNAYLNDLSSSNSDRRLKTGIGAPPEALMRAWGKVGFKVFQFKDAVEKKGAEARIHVGCIAQEIAEAFASEGLDASRYGLFCYDEWEDEWEDVEVVDQEEVVAPDGTTAQARLTHIERRLATPAGNVYSLRYGECLALECAYQRWRLDRLEAQMRGGASEADS